jgi:hypothetical protein
MKSAGSDTTEYKLALAAQVAGAALLLLALVLLHDQHEVAGAAALLGGAFSFGLASFGYSHSRGRAKLQPPVTHVHSTEHVTHQGRRV